MAKWTEPAEAMLQGLLKAHYSAREAAIALSAHFKRRITKNSVIGKCHREGWKLPVRREDGGKRVSKRKTETSQPISDGRSHGLSQFVKRVRDEPKRITAKPGRLAALAAPIGLGAIDKTERSPPVLPQERIETAPAERRCGLLQLNDKRCRWPIGTPGQPEFCFCGGAVSPRLKDAPYCRYHADLAWKAA